MEYYNRSQTILKTTDQFIYPLYKHLSNGGNAIVCIHDRNAKFPGIISFKNRTHLEVPENSLTLKINMVNKKSLPFP